MITKLLVGVDDSPGARAALAWTDRFLDSLADRFGDVSAVMLTAWSRPTIDTRAVFDDAFFRDAARETLEELAAELPDGDRYEQVIRFGYPTFALIDEADNRDADLIVVGTRGRSAVAQVILGSISRGVAAKAERPVAVVPQAAGPKDGADTSGRTIVVGFDGSPGAKAAIRWALENLDGPITAVSAWTMPTPAVYDPNDADVAQFATMAEEAMRTGLKEACGGTVDERITTVVDHEDPRLALLDPELDATCIVMGARAERGIKGLLLGSTVNYVAGHATVPVFVIPPDEAATEPAE